MSDPCEFSNPHLRDLVPYEPGKPIDDVARELGLEVDSVIKLASNENPLGPSPKALEAMREAVDDVNPIINLSSPERSFTVTSGNDVTAYYSFQLIS